MVETKKDILELKRKIIAIELQLIELKYRRLEKLGIFGNEEERVNNG